MERLTSKRDDLVFMCNYIESHTVFDAKRIKSIHDKLMEYEDAEEQGRLVVLPYSIGQQFYTIAYTDNPRVVKVEVAEIFIQPDKTIIWAENVECRKDYWKFEVKDTAILDWGFDTYKEAESALSKAE